MWCQPFRNLNLFSASASTLTSTPWTRCHPKHNRQLRSLSWRSLPLQYKSTSDPDSPKRDQSPLPWLRVHRVASRPVHQGPICTKGNSYGRWWLYWRQYDYKYGYDDAYRLVAVEGWLAGWSCPFVLRWPIPRWGDAWKALGRGRSSLFLKLQADILSTGHKSKVFDLSSRQWNDLWVWWYQGAWFGNSISISIPFVVLPNSLYLSPFRSR